LVCIDYIKFKAGAKKTGDSQSQLQRLKKVWENMRNQDYFSVLGLTRSFKVNEVKKSYHELAKIFHPDKLSDASPNELKDLAKQVFGRMTEAYNILSDEHRRTTYVKELEMGRAEKILQAEALFEAGKSLLTSGQSAKALEKFRAAEALKPPSSDLLIHLAWALLTGLEQDANSAVSVEAERILGRIPPEDRHNATYYFVKGYLQRIQGDLNSAKKNVAHALALKPKFIEAERLLRFLDLQQKGTKPDLLHGDLKNVVGALFKKS
jgi:curved DNA-binding protein CbpA